jgi:hypothetical protein
MQKLLIWNLCMPETDILLYYNAWKLKLGFFFFIPPNENPDPVKGYACIYNGFSKFTAAVA